MRRLRAGAFVRARTHAPQFRRRKMTVLFDGFWYGIKPTCLTHGRRIVAIVPSGDELWAADR